MTGAISGTISRTTTTTTTTTTQSHQQLLLGQHTAQTTAGAVGRCWWWLRGQGCGRKHLRQQGRHCTTIGSLRIGWRCICWTLLRRGSGRRLLRLLRLLLLLFLLIACLRSFLFFPLKNFPLPCQFGRSTTAAATAATAAATAAAVCTTYKSTGTKNI